MVAHMNTFVEIGSNCKETLIDLIDEGWRGLMVEPAKELFDQIPAKENLHLENIAIAEKSGVMEFYYVPENDGWGSLIESHHTKIDPESVADKRMVSTMTFDDLMSKYKFETIDFLKIDAEGYDYKIIMQIDFHRYDIRKIQFEHYHMDTYQKLIIDLLLQRAGFERTETDSMNELYVRK